MSNTRVTYKIIYVSVVDSKLHIVGAIVCGLLGIYETFAITIDSSLNID